MERRKRRRVSGPDNTPQADPPSLIADAFSYTPRTHRIFDRQGFIVLENVLTAAALDTLRSNVDAVLSELYSGGGSGGGGKAAATETETTMLHPEWIMSLHQVLPGGDMNWMWRLATEPKLLALLEQHLGQDIVLFSTQLAIKPPMSGWNVPWHQDGEHCRTVWIPLDNADEENGALRMLSGWHRRGRQRFKPVATEEDVESAEFFQQYHLYASDIKHHSNHNKHQGKSSGGGGGEASSAAVTCNMAAGGLEIHHPLTPHASSPNTSTTRTRRAIIMRYQPSTEPCTGGSLQHWKTGKAFTKANYLVRGKHAAATFTVGTAEGGGDGGGGGGGGGGGAAAAAAADNARPPYIPLPLP